MIIILLMAPFKTNVLTSALTVKNMVRNEEDNYLRGRQVMNQCDTVQATSKDRVINEKK